MCMKGKTENAEVPFWRRGNFGNITETRPAKGVILPDSFRYTLRLASVDIGSNAIRLQINSVSKYQGQIAIKKMEYIRFPLRLGNDVFAVGRIGEEATRKFLRLMDAFAAFMELYDVDDYMICGTSALREAANGQELVAEVLEKTGLRIHIIDGHQEADLINQAIYKFLDEKPYLHIDVGGGSTEITLYQNREKVASESFRIGSVRNMNNVSKQAVFDQVDAWMQENVTLLPAGVVAVGTGGNINKLFELSGSKTKKSRTMTLTELSTIQQDVAQLTLQERINQLMLNPDRADVIVPASEIYLHVMRQAQAKKIMVPDAGLKDGIIDLLITKHKHQL
jgi:exopolyphosphatase / guanosine-5'-triphosphate,3'-diphosphate pyrophosphatase